MKETKTEKIQGYTGKTVRQALADFAVDEERSESYCIEKLVKEGLKKRGYLK